MPKTISIVTEYSAPSPRNSDPLSGAGSKISLGPVSIDTDTITKNLKDQIESITAILKSAQTSDATIEHVDVEFTISADGGVHLIGKATMEVKGSIKVRLKLK